MKIKKFPLSLNNRWRFNWLTRHWVWLRSHVDHSIDFTNGDFRYISVTKFHENNMRTKWDSIFSFVCKWIWRSAFIEAIKNSSHLKCSIVRNWFLWAPTLFQISHSFISHFSVRSRKKNFQQEHSSCTRWIVHLKMNS